MKGSEKIQGKARALSFSIWGLSLLVMLALMQINLAYGADISRSYRIAVTLFNEAEYEAAEGRFSDAIKDGDLSVPKDAAYIINSYYGRASCRIEQGRKLKEDDRLSDALSKYDKAYDDLAVFKGKFEELQESLESDVLYDEMEKHFITISDQMVQLAGEAGDICTRQGRYEPAIEWYDKGLLYISSRSTVYGDILYAKTDAVFQLGRYEDTLRLLSRFEDELSDHAKASNALLFAGDIHRILAERKDGETHFEAALAAYSKVVSMHLEGADVELVKTALLEKARSEKKLGRMEAAIADFQQVQTYYPDTSYEVEAALELGDYAFLGKRYDEALVNFDRAIEVAKSLDLHYFVAVSYYWMGWSYYLDAVRIETEGSPEMEKQSRKLYDDSVDAFKDSIDASDDFWKKEGRETQKAKELEGYYGESLFRIGRGYQGQKKWKDAIKAFEKTPNIYKEWWLKGLAEIAVSKERQGDIDGALVTWDELKKQIRLANVPNAELDLLMRRAESIFDLQRYVEAEKSYREIIVKYPNSPDDSAARVNLGLSLFKQAKDIDAIKEFTALLDKHGRNDALETSIGNALFWRGYLTARLEGGADFTINLKRAIGDYKQVVSRFPQHTRADDAQSEIGFCTYSLGSSDPRRYSEAILEYTKVLENHPGSEYADNSLFEIGRCYRLLDNKRQEEESLRQLVQDFPTSELADDSLLRVAEIHFERAQNNDDSAERQIAQGIYAEVVSKYPDTGSEAISHFQMGSMSYKFDDDLHISATEFGECARVTESLLDRMFVGEYVPADLDVAAIANLLLRSTFWQGESMFGLAEESEDGAQPPDIVKDAYQQARLIYQQLLSRGTRLRTNFPDATQNLYEIMGGADLDVPIIGEAQYMAGRCLYKEGDMVGAKTALQPIKTPDKLRLKAEHLLAAIAYEQGELAGAKTMVENWLNTPAAQNMADEYSVGVQVLQAKIALASGDVSESKALALDTWALFSSVDGLWEESAYIVAKSYQRQNDTEKARTWFEKLQGSSIERWRVIANGGLMQLGDQ
ncbi:tetratricopeptide repeat protein [Candidatus Poribacteria bacterium]